MCTPQVPLPECYIKLTSYVCAYHSNLHILLLPLRAYHTDPPVNVTMKLTRKLTLKLTITNP